MPPSEIRRATLMGAAAVPMWATLASLARATARLPPFETVALAFALAAVLTAAVLAATGRSPGAALRVRPSAWALGVAGLFGYHGLYFAAFRLAPDAPMEINLLNYLWPLLIVLFSAALPGHRLGGRHVAGALAGFAGTATLLGGAASVSLADWPGYLAAAGAAVTWAVYSVLSRRFGDVPSDAVGGFLLATAALSGLVHLAWETTVVPDAHEALALAAMGALPLGAAFFAWDHGCKRGDLRSLGTLAYATPILSTLLLAGVTGRSPDVRVWAACALVVGGAALAGRG